MKYNLINRKSGKMFRKAATREAARAIKRANNFKHSIVRTDTMQVVR